MAKEPGIESIANKPPGAADTGRLTLESGDREVIWILRDTSARIKALAGQPIAIRFNAVILNDVAVIPFLICVGPKKTGNFWETWVNACHPTQRELLEILSRQAEWKVCMVGDSGKVEASMRQPNGLRDFARWAAERTKSLPTWSQSQFERTREIIYEQCPDVFSLWVSLGTKPLQLGSAEVIAPELAAAAARRDDPTFDNGGLSEAEATLRGMFGQVQTLLNCMAPLEGAASLRGLSDYAQKCRLQPALSYMMLHLWDLVISQARQRGLLRPHPVDPEYLALPADFIAVLRGRMDGYGSPPVRTALEWAFHSTYTEIASDLHEKFNSGDPEQREAATFATGMEYENLAAALDYGLRGRLPVLKIYQTLNGYLHQSHHNRRGVELGEKVLQRLQASKDDEFMQIGILREIASHQRRLRQFAEAEATCRKGLRLCRDSKIANTREASGHARALYQKLAALACEQNRWKSAIPFFRKALTISIAQNYRAGQAECHRELARAASRLGDWSRAKEHRDKALELFRLLGDRPAQAAMCMDLASEAMERERLKEARKQTQMALSFFVEFGNKQGEAHARLNLSNLAQHAGKLAAAELQLRKAIKILSDVGEHRGRAAAYNQLAMVKSADGDFIAARKYCRRAMKISKAVEDRYGQAKTCGILAGLASSRGNWPRARRFYLKALDLFRGAEEPIFIGMLHMEFGNAAYGHGQTEEGRENIERGLRYFQDRTNSRLRKRALKRAAQLWQISGDSELPAAVAKVMNITVDEAETRMRNLL